MTITIIGGDMMDIAASSTVTAMQAVKGDFSIGILKKSLDQNKDITSQLFNKVLERSGSLDPSLGKHLDLKV